MSPRINRTVTKTTHISITIPLGWGHELKTGEGEREGQGERERERLRFKQEHSLLCFLIADAVDHLPKTKSSGLHVFPTTISSNSNSTTYSQNKPFLP